MNVVGCFKCIFFSSKRYTGVCSPAFLNVAFSGHRAEVTEFKGGHKARHRFVWSLRIEGSHTGKAPRDAESNIPEDASAIQGRPAHSAVRGAAQSRLVFIVLGLEQARKPEVISYRLNEIYWMAHPIST